MSLEQMFSTFRHDAWRLETLDTYDMADEQVSIDTFLRTGRVPHETPATDDWLALAARTTTQGGYLGRVRLVGELTPYTRWELAAFVDNVASGEDIQVVDRTWIDASWAAAPDVWIFDHAIAYVLRYDQTGAYLGADRAPDVTPYLELRKRISTFAIPLASYHSASIPAPRSELKTPATLPPGVLTVRE